MQRFNWHIWIFALKNETISIYGWNMIFASVCYIVKVMLCYVKQCFNCLSIAHWCQVGLYCLYLLSTEIFEHQTCICISTNREMMQRDSLCFNAPLFSMEIFKPFPKRNELIRKGAWRSNYTWPLRSKLSLSHIFMRLNQESNFKGTTLSSNSSWGKAFHQAEKKISSFPRQLVR